MGNPEVFCSELIFHWHLPKCDEKWNFKYIKYYKSVLTSKSLTSPFKMQYLPFTFAVERTVSADEKLWRRPPAHQESLHQFLDSCVNYNTHMQFVLGKLAVWLFKEYLPKYLLSHQDNIWRRGKKINTFNSDISLMSNFPVHKYQQIKLIS